MYLKKKDLKNKENEFNHTQELLSVEIKMVKRF
jgi:hypothetical protein